MFVSRRDVAGMVARYRQERIRDARRDGSRPDLDIIADACEEYRRSLTDGYLFWGEFW